MTAVPLRVVSGVQAPDDVERLLRALPDWFGIEESVVDYVADAERLPTYLAYAQSEPDGPAIGALLVGRHFPESAEIHLMAVAPALHRRGVGHALLAAAEHDLRADGVTVLQVKTQGPSQPDEDYRRTRAFYLAEGFVPLEEIVGLWAENPCLIMVKPLA
jgi:GNAT superfamily N-acetyltransferase